MQILSTLLSKLLFIDRKKVVDFNENFYKPNQFNFLILPNLKLVFKCFHPSNEGRGPTSIL